MSLPVQAARWDPPSPEELAARRPRVDPDAGVEVLYRELVVDDSDDTMTGWRYFYRLKVFDERGVEKLDKIELPDTPDNPIQDLAARILTPDGRVVELDKSAFFQREVLRQGSVRVRVRSFSFPGLVPGSIVEYRFCTTSEESISGTQLMFQHEWPTWKVHIRFRPYPNFTPDIQMLTVSKGHDLKGLKRNKDGFYCFDKENLPGLEVEPFMPPEAEVQSWVLFYFAPASKSPDAYWQSRGRELADLYSPANRQTSELAARATELCTGAADETEKLRRLYDFCRSEIRNTDLETSGLTPDEVARLKENKSPTDTLTRRYGSPREINLLMVALANAAGIEARVAMVGDRSRRFFDRKVAVWFMLPDRIVAARSAGIWRFFDPGSTYPAFGSLCWQNEGQEVVICDKKHPEFASTPLNSKDLSKVSRSARLTLDEDGTIEGDVTIAYFGHRNVAAKREFAAETAEGREKTIRDGLQQRIGSAEISNLEFKNAESTTENLTITYHLRATGYAEVTGKRLILQPSFFEKGNDPLFKSEARKFPLYFRYPHTTHDSVSITLPTGYQLEEATSPKPVVAGEVISYLVRLVRTKSGSRLGYERLLEQGGVLYPRDAYAAFKEAYDEIHKQDQHALVLRRVEPAPGSEAPPPAGS